jgi:site-specific recombinase XerD
LFNTLGGGAWRANPGDLGARQPLSHSQVYRALKAFFKWAASKASSPRDAAHLEEASTHWLRHTNATLSLEASVSKQDVQELLGHSSGDITDLYIHTQTSKRAAALRKLAQYVNAVGPDDD